MTKVITLSQAADIVKNGDMVALGGNVLHRAPMAMVRELVRKGRKGLKIVKTAGAIDVDMLCFGKCVDSVDAGFISYETEFGLATHYRRSVENGMVKANEHACYTVICALRASMMGVPFMPVKGLKAGDLLKFADYYKIIQDPFGGEKITVVRALVPDVAVIHVQESDKYGNARILGPKYEDILLSRASKKVIVTAENIVSQTKVCAGGAENIDIPHFLVTAVVHAPGGAAPCSCPSFYDIDRKAVETFKALEDEDALTRYLSVWERKDRRGGNGKAVSI
ncbi:MAG: CoA transferase subunit A [Bacillota bacterium]